MSDTSPELSAERRRVRLQTFRQWIEEIAQKEKLDYTGIARKAGLAPSTITRPMNSTGYDGDISARTIGIINKTFKAKIPKVLAGGFFDADLAMVKGDLGWLDLADVGTWGTEGGSSVRDVGDTDRVWRGVPIIGKREGVLGRTVFADGVVPTVARPPELLRSYDAFAVYCSGQGMTPAIREGSLVFADPSLPVRRHDYVVMRRQDGELLIREFLTEASENVIVAWYEGGFTEDAIAKADLVWMYRIVSIKLP